MHLIAQLENGTRAQKLGDSLSLNYTHNFATTRNTCTKISLPMKACEYCHCCHAAVGLCKKLEESNPKLMYSEVVYSLKFSNLEVYFSLSNMKHCDFIGNNSTITFVQA